MAKILILEDDPILGPLLRASLEDHGFEATLCLDAMEAEQAFAKDPADVFVADVIIKKDGVPVPEGGIIASSRIKWSARKMGRRVKVLAISGYVANENMVNVLDIMTSVGADAMMEKPFTPEDLIQEIEKLLPKGA